ncbi:MAG TPA: hypothetical protein VFB45_10815 [Pseudolabrys sp.]|nr:hypothetical protein [Pseudolabrys sp.]
MNRPATTAGANRQWILFVILSCYLIATFLYRMIEPAHEYLMRSAQVLQIGFDLLGLLGLIGLRKHGPQPLFWAALAAGIGLFLIRTHGDASWWTGHFSSAYRPGTSRPDL